MSAADQVIGRAPLVVDALTRFRPLRAPEVLVGRFGSAPCARQRVGKSDPKDSLLSFATRAQLEGRSIERCGLIECESFEGTLSGPLRLQRRALYLSRAYEMAHQALWIGFTVSRRVEGAREVGVTLAPACIV